MSVRIRAFRNGGWELDIRVQLPDRTLLRERVKAPTQSKSAALRWGYDRERELLLNGKPQKQKGEVERIPTLTEFADRFLADARANQQKPSAVAAKETIVRVHLIPHLGGLALDAVTTEAVQRLKSTSAGKAPKTVNNILTVLSVLLRTAVDWEVIKQLPCQIKLLKPARTSVGFYDFDQYQRLVEAAEVEGKLALLIVLLGGDAGLRCGEMMALEWGDVDFRNNQLVVRRSEWKGQVTMPKGGRIRYVPLTARLAKALGEQRHLRGTRVLLNAANSALTQRQVQGLVKRSARRADLRLGVHALRHTFCSHLMMEGAQATAIQKLAGHQHLVTTERYMHLAPGVTQSAIRLLDRRHAANRGDIVETVGA